MWIFCTGLVPYLRRKSPGQSYYFNMLFIATWPSQILHNVGSIEPIRKIAMCIYFLGSSSFGTDYCTHKYFKQNYKIYNKTCRRKQNGFWPKRIYSSTLVFTIITLAMLGKARLVELNSPTGWVTFNEAV